MGESYDATRLPAGWSSPGFDDSAWSPVDVSDPISAKLEAHPGFPVREIRALEPREMREVAPDTWVLDLGQNIAGVARLKVARPGRAEDRAALRRAPEPRRHDLHHQPALARARPTATSARVARSETWEPRFTFHGFQYIEVTGLGRRPEHDTVVGVALSSDTPVSGSFETSDAMINRLYQNTCWTQRENFIDVPTDCPQRDERLGWTGDAQVYIRTANFVADAQAFYTKWLVDLEDAQRADGQFPMVAPLKVAGDDGGPAWADAGVDLSLDRVRRVRRSAPARTALRIDEALRRVLREAQREAPAAREVPLLRRLGRDPTPTRRTRSSSRPTSPAARASWRAARRRSARRRTRRATRSSTRT